jgi:hypothetical protein
MLGCLTRVKVIIFAFRALKLYLALSFLDFLSGFVGILTFGLLETSNLTLKVKVFELEQFNGLILSIFH